MVDPQSDAQPSQAELDDPSGSANEREPKLSYERFGSDQDVPGILARDAATAFAVSPKLLALGTESGKVHLLDYEGNKVNSFQEHTGPVADLSFDAEAETLVSCSSDGYVVVYGLYSGEVSRHKCRHPVTTVAVDPRYGSRKTKEFVYGSSTGSLVLVSSGWLGNSETMLFQGKGRVHSARMAGTLLAWATDTGVRVYDTADHTRVGKVDHPAKAAGGGAATTAGGAETKATADCRLDWVGRQELLVAWDGWVMAVEVAPVTPAPAAAATGNTAAAATPVSLTSTLVAVSPLTRAVTTQASAKFELRVGARFELPGGVVVAGVAPFGPQQLAVLTWRAQERVGQSADAQAEFVVLNRAGETLFSDPLAELNGKVLLSSSTADSGRQMRCPPIMLASFYSLSDLKPSVPALPQLHPTSTLSKSPAGTELFDGANGGERGYKRAGNGAETHPMQHQGFRWWSEGAEPMYFALARRSAVVGRPCSAADRIAWLSERNRFAEALEVAESDVSVKPLARLALGEQYLRHLCEAGRYAEAAELAPRLLAADAAAWERWLYIFGQAAQLPLLAPKLPTADPALTASAYDLALAACLNSAKDHETLKELVETWPRGCYDAAALLSKVSPRLRRATDGAAPSAALRRVAASLHSHLGNHAAALRLLLELRCPSAFDYLKNNALASTAAPLAAELLDLDEVQAASLLVESSDEAPPSAVVASLQARLATFPEGDTASKLVWSRRLFHYLDWLWKRDSALVAPFVELHVALCAEHDPPRLLNLLTVSAAYPLDSALRVCEERGLVRESVYILGRMGSADAALRLIVGRLRDVEGAVAFVQEQRDDELWELLISLTLGDAALAGALLDHAGGAVDPLKLVTALPAGLAIDRLRDRLVRVIVEFRGTLGLQSGCNAVLRADCLELGDRLYALLRRALSRMHLMAPGGRWALCDAAKGGERSGETADEASRELGIAFLGGGGSGEAEAVLPAGPGGRRVWIGSGSGSTQPHLRPPSPHGSHASPNSKFPRRGPPAA